MASPRLRNSYPIGMDFLKRRKKRTEGHDRLNSSHKLNRFASKKKDSTLYHLEREGQEVTEMKSDSRTGLMITCILTVISSVTTLRFLNQ
uniref:Ovule protein n=2 Tax=Caenorhabditis tropicalis TaxID=1561998 RepID=A0A1I7T0X5_9PELO